MTIKKHTTPVRSKDETIVALRESLAETVRALEAHIQEESKDAGVPAEELCPCTTEEVARAHKLLAEVAI